MLVLDVAFLNLHLKTLALDGIVVGAAVTINSLVEILKEQVKTHPKKAKLFDVCRALRLCECRFGVRPTTASPKDTFKRPNRLYRVTLR